MTSSSFDLSLSFVTSLYFVTSVFRLLSVFRHLCLLLPVPLCLSLHVCLSLPFHLLVPLRLLFSLCLCLLCLSRSLSVPRSLSAFRSALSLSLLWDISPWLGLECKHSGGLYLTRISFVLHWSPNWWWEGRWGEGEGEGGRLHLCNRCLFTKQHILLQIIHHTMASQPATNKPPLSCRRVTLELWTPLGTVWYRYHCASSTSIVPYLMCIYCIHKYTVLCVPNYRYKGI